ncbi:hypothetical protein ACTS9T_08795 [Empedobacter falsenii]|uniref:hypothetical protein n=1 Tax=Empedobacter TaxID=59734 RepID=UPI00056EE093|nr:MULTISPECIES: hypothetical protein [Empedobacter]MDH1884101.1 hypothetical protein [Empedobacter sp. GD03797]MDM1043198.1 hypothetical protein [Empedobacter brevis]MDM1137129.1 hypothetical protein [Empedobacter sp. R750]HAD80168.1 hypothetical protein [Flavobacteriaceae bacterium]
MSKFLTLKHWQVFALLIGVPFILQIVTFSLIIVTKDPKTLTYTFPITTIIYLVLFLSWFYSLGTNLNKKLSKTVKMNLSKFKIFLIIPIVYIFILSIYQAGIFTKSSINEQPNPIVFAFIIPTHLFSMFCIFYSLYFIAKELKSVELQKPVTFSDFAGEFFLLWFFPIGIWIIQPRINKIFESK